jgi:hypothetical protein
MGNVCLGVVALAAVALALVGLGHLTKVRGVCLIFAALAAAGLAVSAAVHFSTFAGVDPLDVLPLVWVLHLGIFLVFAPGIAAANRVKRGDRGSFASQFPHAPRWLIGMTGFLFVYALVNFAVFIFLMRDGSPTRREDGTYAVTDHGRVVREISAGEFHRRQGYVARGFSGHWMLFYSAALTMLVSSARASAARQEETGLVDGTLVTAGRTDAPADSVNEGA